MQSATDAGRSARTTTDAPHPQEPHATPCDRCQTRSADGVAPDGRSLCAGCADDERTLVCDGGQFNHEVYEAAKRAEAALAAVRAEQGDGDE